MNPGQVIASAIFLPLIMLLLLVGPVYAGAFAGLTWLYGTEASESALNLDYQIATYQALYQYWQANRELVGWFDFLIPAFAPPLVGLASGLLFFVSFVRYIRGVMVTM